MNLLLDSHILLWFLSGNPLLSGTARRLIESRTNHVYVSAASLWELWIKHSIGKLQLPYRFEDRLRLSGIVELPVSGAHARAVGSLPWHHRDPFDRMLVAQATVENMVLLTADRTMEPYGPVVMVV